MILALVVSLLAGLATSVGGLLAMHRRTLEREVLAVALAFAAGAMLLVSFVQILPLGIEWMAETQPLMAAQAIVVGRGFDELAARHYFDSLRIVES